MTESWNLHNNPTHREFYEVAGQLIKNVSDATDKLIDLQKKMKELNKDEEGPKSVTNNALFVGSTAELDLSS